jgi:anti-sigma regulatory factor (Ser/Thr protein kinase)
MTDKNDKNVISLHYDVDGENFMTAGEASSDVKKVLLKLGINSITIRNVAIAMYEGEINMVIHAHGGKADIFVYDKYIEIILKDQGPGIPDIDLAMQEGYSTAPDNIRALGFGAGMGLPNMKKYSDYMDIKSEVGKGTTVTMKVNIIE